jgi:hypothetical protein
MERFQGNGRVPADMYVTTEVPFYATSVYCGIVPIAHSRAGLRSETGTSKSTSFAANVSIRRSVSFMGRDYCFCRALTKIFKASSFKKAVAASTGKLP